MSIEETLKSISSNPGVYFYKNVVGEIIYIGKAIDLSRRVRQYFQRDDAVGDKTPKLVSEIAAVETIETENEFDALLLEAKLIKFYQPKFNIISKDDKSPLYIAISIEEELPRVYFTRKPKSSLRDKVLYFGPFQSAKAARGLLRSLRRVVPYCTQKQRNGKKCFYTHLGLCNPCPSYISKLDNNVCKQDLIRKYRQNIFRLRDILSEKAVEVIKSMEDEMKNLSSQDRFEDAALVRNQLLALKSVLKKRYDPILYIQSDTMVEEIFQNERAELEHVLLPYYPALKKLHRIECFDISNTMGTNATASMVVMTEGRIDKTEYRKFRIKTKKTPNDFIMMAEVLTRRFNHPEWPFPDLLIVDGGKGQVTAAKKVMSANTRLILIPLIGLAKRDEEIVVPVGSDWKIIRLPFSSGGLKCLQRLRDEAHRFAITYHKLLRGKSVLPS